MGVHYYIKVPTQNSGKRRIDFGMEGGKKFFTSLYLIRTIDVSNLDKRLKIGMFQTSDNSTTVCVSVYMFYFKARLVQ